MTSGLRLKRKMKREDFLSKPVQHMKLQPDMTVNQLVQQFSNSGSFGAGRLAEACDVYEKMARDEKCTIFLALAGAMVPAGLRTVIADLMKKRLIDALVSTGANMVHDLIEATGGHHIEDTGLLMITYYISITFIASTMSLCLRMTS
jgi:deoxyhypusine synthase